MTPRIITEYKNWVVNSINNMESPNTNYRWDWIRGWMGVAQYSFPHHKRRTGEDIAILLSQTLKENRK